VRIFDGAAITRTSEVHVLCSGRVLRREERGTRAVVAVEFSGYEPLSTFWAKAAQSGRNPHLHVPNPISYRSQSLAPEMLPLPFLDGLELPLLDDVFRVVQNRKFTRFRCAIRLTNSILGRIHFYRVGYTNVIALWQCS